MIDTITILLIIFGALTGAVLIFGITIFILWNRRKLIFTNFLTESGKWERKSHKEIGHTFEYDGCTYNYDLKMCTRDAHNRPVAHYYKDNPAQMIYEFENRRKTVNVGNANLTGMDFKQILLTKIIRDIFTDDDDKIWFIVIICIIVLGFALNIILMMSNNKPVTLDASNETINTIVQGVNIAIKGG